MSRLVKSKLFAYDTIVVSIGLRVNMDLHCKKNPSKYVESYMQLAARTFLVVREP